MASGEISMALKGGGAPMPALGFGCWKLGKDTANMVYEALRAGFRTIDSAADYGNEKEVGLGLARAMAEGIVRREDVWVTSKLWCTDHAPEHVEPALRRTLSDLGLSYVDAYLVHFPIPLKYVSAATRYPAGWIHDPAAAAPRMEFSGVPLAATWSAMSACVDKGLAKHIGVCNMTTGLLRDLSASATAAGVRPIEVLQVEMHPYLVQSNLVRFAKEAGIAVTAFSPLGAPSYVELGMATVADSALREAAVVRIAERIGATPGQVLIAWALARGTAPIPKSSSATRIAENFGALAVVAKLTRDDVAEIEALDKHRRFNDPAVFCEKAFNTYCPIYD